ncbi:replication factor A protein 3 [Lenzites betulinus]|nr:replication factor A protein 3 [Lenzites betulinus]
MSDHRSPRVNKARMADYKGQTVRLIAKILSFRDDVAIVEASDNSEVEVKLLKDVKIEAAYIEVIGQVVDERTIKMMGCIQLGNDVDMKLANDVVEVWHDPKFASMF